MNGENSMKVGLLLLAVPMLTHAAEWVPAGRNQLLTAYYDPATIRRNGDMAIRYPAEEGDMNNGKTKCSTASCTD